MPSDTARLVREATSTPEFRLEEIFRKPFGPRGLEYSERARALEGRRVRLTGFAVRQTHPIPFAIILAPTPAASHESEYGLADDLPVNTVHAHFPKGPHPVLPWSRNPIVVEGVLELGPHEEADGRISHARIRVAEPWIPKRPTSPPPPAGGNRHSSSASVTNPETPGPLP